MRTRRLQLVILILVALSVAVVAPATVSVYFSPRGGGEEAVAVLARGATMYLDAACYTFTLSSIADELLAARQRGVRVRVIVDRAQGVQQYSQAGRLVAAGIPVKTNRHTGLMHDKFLVADGRSVATGSFNWTRAAAEKNDENLVVFIAEPVVAGAFARQFESMWTDTARFADYRPEAQQFAHAQLQSGRQASQSTGGGTVYITRSGKKYHRAGCSSLSKSKIAITKSEAVAKGYSPCGRCKP